MEGVGVTGRTHQAVAGCADFFAVDQWHGEKGGREWEVLEDYCAVGVGNGFETVVVGLMAWVRQSGEQTRLKLSLSLLARLWMETSCQLKALTPPHLPRPQPRPLNPFTTGRM